MCYLGEALYEKQTSFDTLGRSLREEMFAKNCEDLWGFFFILQVLYKWMPLSFALRNHSPKQIPHKVATGHHTYQYVP